MVDITKKEKTTEVHMKKLTIGVIGYGGMGSYHVEHLLSQSDGFQIAGIVDLSLERQQIAKENGLKVYDNQNAIFADDQVDLVLVATPNDSHKEISIAAMYAGKHVICEKPATITAQDLEEVIDISEQTNRSFIVHQNRRWDPDFLIVKELYEKGEIGDIFQIESRVQGANGIPGDWRHEKMHGGGMLLDWGVHLFDQILWLVNSPVETIYTDLSYVLGNEVDDGFTTFLTFSNGLKVVVEVGTTNYTKLPRWYIKGTKGTAKIMDWDLNGEVVIAKETNSIAEPTPIKAGVGLTKTMAPPSEDSTKKRGLPTGSVMEESFYENIYNVLTRGSQPIVQTSEVLKIAKLMDQISEMDTDRVLENSQFV